MNQGAQVTRNLPHFCEAACGEPWNVVALRPSSIFAPLPSAQFSCITADPPYRFHTRSAKGQRRAPSAHYADLTIDEIMSLPVSTIAAPSAWLFLWTTGPHLESAFRIISAWGFAYSGIGFTWLKLRNGINAGPRLVSTADLDRELFVGLGLTTRHNVELCLLAKRGRPKRLSYAVREVIITPVREHSRKPDEFYQRVEAFCPGPGQRIDLFGRQSRDGWQTWGAESTKFDVVDDGGAP